MGVNSFVGVYLISVPSCLMVRTNMDGSAGSRDLNTGLPCCHSHDVRLHEHFLRLSEPPE